MRETYEEQMLLLELQLLFTKLEWLEKRIILLEQKLRSNDVVQAGGDKNEK